MLPIDDIIAVLRDYVPDSTTLQSITKELLRTEREAKAAGDKAGPKAKTRLAILVRGTPELQRLVTQGAYIVSLPDGDDDPTTTTYMGQALVERIRKAAIAHNEAPKGRRKAKRRIQTLHDAMTLLKAKTIKESGSVIGIKQKGTPAEVVVVLNEDLLSPSPSIQ